MNCGGLTDAALDQRERSGLSSDDANRAGSPCNPHRSGRHRTLRRMPRPSRSRCTCQSHSSRKKSAVASVNESLAQSRQEGCPEALMLSRRHGRHEAGQWSVGCNPGAVAARVPGSSPAKSTVVQGGISCSDSAAKRPAPQRLQEELPAVETRPSGHDEQIGWAVLSEKKPAMHSEHASWPGLLDALPGGQGRHEARPDSRW